MKKLNIIFSLTLTLIAFLACAPFQSSPYPSLKIGDEATDFKLKNVDGKLVSMTSYPDAKGFIVVFTCNHCPYAKAYESRLLALDKKYKAKGYPVIAINPNDPAITPDDSYEKMIENHKEKGFTFPYLFDETQETAKAYGAAKTPHVYILTKNESKYIVQYIGAIDNNYKSESEVTEKYVENAIESLVKGEKIKVTETKAIGCTIKWKK
jgi:peroxiredoxin